MPDRSTTRAVTERLTRRGLSAFLVVLVVAACGWLAVQPTTALPASSSPPAVQPLVVGDDRTVELISLGGSATDELARRVAAEIGPCVRSVESFWGTDWSHDIVVVATATDDQFSGQAGGANARMAAVAVADEVDPDRGLVHGQRIVLAPGASAMSDGALRIVLGHELFHFAARADTATDAPRWLTEGVADYVARPESAAPARLRTPSALPSDAEFAATGDQLTAAYDRAWLFARFVAQTHGAPALKKLYLRAAGPRHVDAATALREVLRAEPDDLLREWRAWLARV